jgi:hypothetical protein
MIVWSQMALKSKFRFWIILSLGVRASNASELPMIGYLLELFYEESPAGATIMMRRPPFGGVPTGTFLDLGVIIH